MNPPKLSIVIPARNEARRLPASLAALDRFMSEYGSSEVVIVADETSTDGTVEVATAHAERDERMRVITVETRGKGNAVREGTRAARGSLVVMADADLSVGPDQFDALLQPASAGAVAIASRSVPGAERIGEPLSRYLLGRIFNAVVRATILPGIRDTQCGFKAMPRATALRIFSSLSTSGWVFDVELLARARREGIVVREVPVRWHYGHASALRPLHDATDVARELLALWRRYGRVPRREG